MRNITNFKNQNQRIQIKNCDFKWFKIEILYDLLAFTRTGPINARACPVNARVSIALGSLNLPGGQF